MTKFVVYLWPALALGFLLWFFVRYYRDVSLGPKGPMYSKEPLSLDVPRGRMEKRDWLLMLLLTAVYAAAAFWGLGDTQAPQSFWQAEAGENSVTLTLEEPVKATKFVYYTGLHTGTYALEVQDSAGMWHRMDDLSQNYAEIFKWASVDLKDTADVQAIRLTAMETPLWLGEIALCTDDGDGNYTLSPLDVADFSAPSGEALVDEQALVPTRFTYLNSFYFDEIYHARTAYEHINGIYPYEITHPPLGKLILALGIQLFGMTPFGWRFSGTLIGVLMLPLMYLLVKSMFRRTSIALCGTLLFAFDFMHFTQTRIATIDSYSVFFILLMYLFMWRWFSSGMEAPFRKTALPLFLTGLAFGLGVSAKWTCVYAGAGLFVLYLIYLFCRGRVFLQRGEGREFARFLGKTLALSVVAFLLVPAVIYTLCYLPYAAASQDGLSLQSLVREMLKNQSYMFNYHSGVMDPHPYSSTWYMWILDIRPILYYRDYMAGDTLKSAFSAFGNPLVWIGGLAALFLAGSRFLRKKRPTALFLIVGYLSQFLPWLLIGRTTFAYHYFPSTVFLVLALCFVFHEAMELNSRARNRMFAFTGVCMALFVVFYPSLTGVYMPTWYFDYFLRWLPSWPL